MKDKIRCLFDKINKFFHSEQFFDDVLPLITVGVVIFSVVFCSLLNLMSASAADYDSTMILKAGTYRFNDTIELEIGGNLAGQYFDFVCSSTEIVDGKTIYLQFEGKNLGTNPHLNPPRMTYYGGFKAYVDGVLDEDISSIYINPYEDGTWNEYPWMQTMSIPIDTEVDYAFGTWYISNTNYNEVNGGSPSECPTLEEQIAQYSGSWVQFINMVRQNNPMLGNSYQNVVNEAIVAGKISVQGDFINFSGTYEELLQLLMTTSNNNPNIQAVLDQELQRHFENGVDHGYDVGYVDGKDHGHDVGYKEGYLNGLNKGQSDASLKSFFGDFINGCVDVIDSIHFYEEYDSNGKLIFYLSPWSIVILLLMVVIVIILLKVWRGG